MGVNIEAMLAKISLKAGWKDVNNSQGGLPKYTRTDIISALPRVDYLAMDDYKLTSSMLMYYYMGESAFEFAAAQALLNKVMQGAYGEYEVGTKKRTTALIFMALHETIGSMSWVTCRSCRGRAMMQPDACQYCQQGKQPRVKMNTSARVKMMDEHLKALDKKDGMTRYHWKANCEGLYASLCEDCVVALSDGLKFLGEALEGRPES